MQIRGNGRIEKLGRNKYRVRFNLGFDPAAKKYKYTPWRIIRGSKEEARRAKEAYRAELEESMRFEMGNMTFSEYAKTFHEMRATLLGLADSTIETEKYQIKLLEKYLGTIQMRNIDITTVKKALFKLVKEDGISKTRLHDITVKVKQIFRQAAEENVINVNPIRKLVAPQRSRPNRNSLQLKEAQSLLAVLDKLALDRNVVAVYIGLATGLRRGEVLSLRWSNIDLDRCSIRVRHSINKKREFTPAKTPASFRNLAIDDRTAHKLREWKTLQSDNLKTLGFDLTEDTIVCGTHTGGVCTPDRFSKWFRNFCIKNHFAVYVDDNGKPLPVYRCNEKGVEIDENGRPFSRVNKKPKVKKHYVGLKFHELRHTQATLLLAHGVPIKTVQARLGHADASTTLNFYGHALPEQDHEAAQLFSSLLISGPEHVSIASPRRIA